jgi:hypothetical protein
MIILQSIDWKHLAIDVFTIEIDQHRQDILTFMKTHGYKWIQTHPPTIQIHTQMFYIVKLFPS